MKFRKKSFTETLEPVMRAMFATLTPKSKRCFTNLYQVCDRLHKAGWTQGETAWTDGTLEVTSPWEACVLQRKKEREQRLSPEAKAKFLTYSGWTRTKVGNWRTDNWKKTNMRGQPYASKTYALFSLDRAYEIQLKRDYEEACQ